MVEHRLTAWLRPVLSLLALAGLLSLAACGGGGSPNNPYSPGPSAPPTLVVQPTQINIFPGTPATLTIQSGTAPFQVFSDTPNVLPVQQTTSSTSIVLLANQVSTQTAVRLTVTDASGQTVPIGVNVLPAPLLNNLTFTPTGGDCGADLCSAQTGTARVVALGIAGAPLPGRQIKFDVVFGPIAFNTNNPANPQAQTITVVTDNVGLAQVAVVALANATTQPAQIRATDVTSGNQQIVNFNVVNNTTAGQSPIVVVPATANITGPNNQTCSTGFRIDYYVFGGSPPYTVQSTFPQAVQLLNNVVSTSGGFFSAVTNGSCVNPLVFTITDSAGKQVTAQLQNVVGTTPVTPPPQPAALAVIPGTVTDVCGSNKTYTFVITGGVPPYNITAIVNPALPNPPPTDNVTVSPQVVGGNGGSFAVTTAGAPADFAGKSITLVILDSSPTQQVVNARITCS
jgi:hypothetical protein